jgi:hypothetical protein
LKFKLNKLTIVVLFLLISLLTNNFQFQKSKEYERICDSEFDIGIQIICSGIEQITDGKDLEGMAVLASGTSQVATIYSMTSYYKKNTMLYRPLNMLNNNITNKINIREVIETKDLSILIPVLKKVLGNPLDEEATKQLDYLVRKHTVIGSTLK